jgi:Tat protein translocase TatB subunit
MFGSIGGSEFLLIAVLALLLFGPRKLPQIGRSIGRALAEFRGATQEFKSSLEREVKLEELRDTGKDLAEAGREIRSTVDEATRPAIARGSLERDDTPRAAAPTGATSTEQDPPGEPDDSSDGETRTQS